MRIRAKINGALPGGISITLAVVSAILFALAYPDFEIAILAWVALVPLLLAVITEKGSFAKSFVSGWIFGTVFFFLTGWWLTFAPITYAGFPFIVAYVLLFCVTLVAGIFAGLACGLTALCIERFGRGGLFAAPFFWVAAEFLRYWLTGNNWNTAGYSLAFTYFVELASIGGVHLVGFLILLLNAAFAFIIDHQFLRDSYTDSLRRRVLTTAFVVSFPLFGLATVSGGLFEWTARDGADSKWTRPNEESTALVVAVQPNVPMAGLDRTKWTSLRARQAKLADFEISKLRSDPALAGKPIVVILPESPMNYQYAEDAEFRNFINGFAVRNGVSVLFNSAEPDPGRKYGFFNSAVLISKEGKMVAQYDKIHLLPFGEFVPLPEFAQGLIPPMVGRFSFGKEYDLLAVGDAKAGVMICFESHFPSLSREYVANGADIIIEMTNDGYLGPTPVLRQHLASAAFRAAETHRPLVRATNVGVTAFISEWGVVFDDAPVYEEAVRVWGVNKSEGKITYYVRYGDWFAWLCAIVSIGLAGSALIGRSGGGAVGETG